VSASVSESVGVSESVSVGETSLSASVLTDEGLSAEISVVSLIWLPYGARAFTARHQATVLHLQITRNSSVTITEPTGTTLAGSSRASDGDSCNASTLHRTVSSVSW
jgi:hypothetical protein